MTGCGRKLPLKSSILLEIERPLWGKADILPTIPKFPLPNGRYTLGSGHSANIGPKVR